MPTHFVDRFIELAAQKKGPVCVGLDPDVSKLPKPLLERAKGGDNGNLTSQLTALNEFCRGVLRSVAAHVPAVKINIAFFECHGHDGWRLYEDLVQEAHRLGLLVIGDVKRGDIEHSSGMYARAHLSGDRSPDSAVDAITVNPYFGIDGIRPFIEMAQQTKRGLFALVQTSNESAATVQSLRLADGRLLVEQVGDLVRDWADAPELTGRTGYSLVGAVVSPRDVEMTRRLRELMPQSLFLVPGFGAQGRTQQEVACCFRADGAGAVVNASRSVIYAFDQPRYRDRFGDDWTAAVSEAAAEFAIQVRTVAGSGKS